MCCVMSYVEWNLKDNVKRSVKVKTSFNVEKILMNDITKLWGIAYLVEIAHFYNNIEYSLEG